MSINAGDFIYAVGDANLLNAPKNGGALTVLTVVSGDLIGSATGKTVVDKGSTFVEIAATGSRFVANAWVDIDSVRAEAPTLTKGSSRAGKAGNSVVATDVANVLSGPFNGGATVLFAVSVGDLLGSATGNTFSDVGSFFVQFTESGTTDGSVAGRISYVDIDSVVVVDPKSAAAYREIDFETGETTKASGDPATGVVTTEKTDATGKVVVAKTDSKTGKVATGTGTKDNPPIVADPKSVSKWLTYGLYALIGLSVVAVGFILVRLSSSPQQPALTPHKK